MGCVKKGRFRDKICTYNLGVTEETSAGAPRRFPMVQPVARTDTAVSSEVGLRKESVLSSLSLT